jgi:outer membrane protein OmpA-like peptidoglycan-associated protein/tetratricopeptide (TPR) repeat protein
MKKIIYLLLSFCVSGGVVYAQKDVPFDKETFKDRKEELKEALKAIKQADKLAELDRNYDEALPLYMIAQKYNPNNAELNYKIGEAHIKAIKGDKKAAVQFLEKAKALNPTVNPALPIYLGRAYHFNLEFDKAIEQYQAFMKILSNEKDLIELTQRRIKECENGKILIKKPIRVFVDNVGDGVNTEYPDYGPVITTDESVLYFTSRRPDSYGGKKTKDGQYFEDVYVSFKKGKNWEKAANLGKPINSEDHDATVTISPDGSRMIIYKEINGGDLYECKLEGAEWSKPKPISSVNTAHHETTASYSFDGKTLFFVSNRPDKSLGGSDIFMSKLGPDGNWGQPVNLGTTINTPYDEEGVFAHPDGKTIYFSSKGHQSMGDYDIFIAVKNDSTGKWGKPKNIGYPINTPGDDVFFVVNANGRRGYYASAAAGGYGDKDIYVVTILGPEKPVLLNTESQLLAGSPPQAAPTIEPEVEVVSNQLTLFKGLVLDSVNKRPIEAELVVTDNATNEQVTIVRSNSQSGKFLIALPSGKNYGIAVKAEGYLFHSENFNLPPGGDFQEVNKDVLLKRVEVGKSIVLKNIFFDFAKATLRPESETELQNLLKLLNENPTMRIEISGHTDNVGSDANNQKLSENRALAVVNYLIDKGGISKSRLTYKGYGASQPIDTNNTEEGRQNNRRTEFKVIGK